MKTKSAPKHPHGLKTQSQVTTAIIRTRSGISEMKYLELQFDLGRDFIHRLFDVDGYEDMIDFYMQDSASGFWKWWKAECINQEREIFHALQAHRSSFNKNPGEIHNLVCSKLSEMVTCDRVHKSFLNHTKFLLR